MNGMDTTTQGWTEDEARAVAAAVRAAQERMVVGPPPSLALGTAEPGPGRRRAPLLAAAAVVLVALVVGGVVTATRQAHPSPSSIAQGDLLDDKDFLAAVKQRLLAVASTSSRPGSVADVSVSAAFDVPGGRFALLQWPGATPARPYRAWLLGPLGAAAGNLTLGITCSTDDLICSTMRGAEFGDEGATTWVYATVPGSRITWRTGNDVLADGTLHSDETPAEELSPGIFTATLHGTRGVRIEEDLVVPGHPEQDPNYTFTNRGSEELGRWWAYAARDARGTPLPAADGLPATLARRFEIWTGMELTTDSRVLWTHPGPHGGAALIAGRGASSGWAVVALNQAPADSGTDTELTAVLTRPADGLDGLNLAWPVGHTGNGIGLLGPRTATTARVGSDDGSVDVDLTDGAGYATVAGARSVAFLDGAGTQLAQVDVTAEWPAGKGFPGTTAP